VIINRLCSKGVLKPIIVWGIPIFITWILASFIFLSVIYEGVVVNKMARAMFRGGFLILVINFIVVHLISKVYYSVIEYYEIRKCGGPFIAGDMIMIRHGENIGFNGRIDAVCGEQEFTVMYEDNTKCNRSAFDLILIKRIG